ncbi:discoidin domain-containing protein [Virgisporangium aliadipatigenens]|uniref:discoidin domain-containing protein n=1 Tax=Virgisporangium aliadipatigenens TaxID=741659 RepID=UPI0019410EAC|nr:discoidin domain-containing protein [Virgisporangium aliadipatigenens]
MSRQGLPIRATSDLVLVGEVSGPPAWWRAGFRFLTVVLRPDRVDPAELGERLVGTGQVQGRPVLLVCAGEPVSDDFRRRLADQVQTPVFSRGPRAAVWTGVWPRRAGRQERGPVPLSGGSFDTIGLDDLLDEPAPATAALPPLGEQPWLDLRSAPADAGGRPELLLDRGPGGEHPFALFGTASSVWSVAVAVAARRPDWVHRDRLIRLDVPEVGSADLQLLANYLGARLMIPGDRVTDVPPERGGSGWLLVRPRIAGHTSSTAAAGPGSAAGDVDAVRHGVTMVSGTGSASPRRRGLRAARPASRAAVAAVLVSVLAAVLGTAAVLLGRTGSVAIGCTSVAPERTPSPPAPAAAAPSFPVKAPTATGRANPERRNLALSGTASASSTEGPRAPRNAIDGDPATRWTSGAPDPQWITIDLHEAWALSEIRLTWERDYASRYRVEISDDGDNWLTVWSTGNGSGGTAVVNLPLLTGRFVRMTASTRLSGPGYSLVEFDVR